MVVVYCRLVGKNNLENFFKTKKKKPHFWFTLTRVWAQGHTVLGLTTFSHYKNLGLGKPLLGSNIIRTISSTLLRPEISPETFNWALFGWKKKSSTTFTSSQYFEKLVCKIQLQKFFYKKILFIYKIFI